MRTDDGLPEPKNCSPLPECPAIQAVFDSVPSFALPVASAVVPPLPSLNGHAPASHDGETMPPMKQPEGHIPLWHTLPLPQSVPSLRGACAQVPALSQASLVQGLPSSGQLKPAGMG